MFEVLAESEATELMRILSSSYQTSRELCKEITARMNSIPDYVVRMEYNRDLIVHGSIRAENTSIRWQIKAETQS